jgi:hypothetical protein
LYFFNFTVLLPVYNTQSSPWRCVGGRAMEDVRRPGGGRWRGGWVWGGGGGGTALI